MADLEKNSNREDWLTWAIEFMRRVLWADDVITVHGPHDASKVMWGDVTAWRDGQESGPSCSFRAIAGRSKYRPVRVRIRNAEDEEETYPVLKVSELTPRARKWLRAARKTLRELRRS